MTEERIKLFLKFFYETYITNCYEGFELDGEEKSLEDKIEAFDFKAYFILHLDIYVENVDLYKEYSKIYDPSLFSQKRALSPEPFNDLELFLIDTIQLFVHTLLESALVKIGLSEEKIKTLTLYFRNIDNEKIYLSNLIDAAELKMREINQLPPAQG